ncbi:unnamed protein product [Bacillus thuringiensis DB27]|uniref:Uncharacterized protein n=1 Tax=Bacillus thuringiensis DB27 TaxID=1431339 RepID=W8ZB37_BACTU|nr:unnamed protein product [Bacillus thuringiensis DB27]
MHKLLLKIIFCLNLFLLKYPVLFYPSHFAYSLSLLKNLQQELLK